MMTQETEKVRKQMQIVCIDDLVPQDHLLRIIDRAIDFVYSLRRKPAMASVLFAGTFAGNPIFKITFKNRKIVV